MTSGHQEHGEPADELQQEQSAGEQPDGPQEGGEEVNGLAADLAGAQQDVAALTADLQRLQAEYVNYKRRVDRDRELVQQNATFKVLSALLPVLDALDRAREHGELEGGFKAIADSLENIVAAQGLVKFGKPGDEFDPRFHEAVMHAHSPEVTTTTCQHIVNAGYQIGERVVRPATVTVVDPEPAEAAPAEGEEQIGDQPRQ
ncbi:MAG TPA: nucleotide exchange factor GrpE [Nocardioidaceae bacterium]|nr:nucleotide exchange factor GrpE [Nocardioidaceae bacterium]